MTQTEIETVRGEPKALPMTHEIAGWLCTAMQADDVFISRFVRLPGGAIQDNWILDVDVTGGPWTGAHAFVLRTDAPSGVSASLTRAQEFAVLRAAHAAGVVAPKPFFLCRDLSIISREFFVMEHVSGLAAGHRLTRERALVAGRRRARGIDRHQSRRYPLDPASVRRA